MTVPRAWAVRAWGEIAPHGCLAAVLAAAAVAWAVWVSGPGWSTPAFVAAAVGWSVLGVVDARTHRLPDVLTYPTTIVSAVLLVLAAAATGHGADLVRAVVAGLAVSAGYTLMWFVAPVGGVGLGDVKLAVSIGLVTGWSGWAAVAIAVLAPWIVAGIPAMVILVKRRARHEPNRHLAFGPYMLVGAVIAVTWTTALQA